MLALTASDSTGLMNVFAMVSTEKSAEYTPYALKSFWEFTKIGADDEFYLIDNDGHFDKSILKDYPLVKLKTNDAPKSFAENVNQIMSYAQTKQADIYFLNNDLIFTEGWFEPIDKIKIGIISPVSNGEFQYKMDGFELLHFLSLEDYNSNKDKIAKIISKHKSTESGRLRVLMFPFFAVKITYQAYSKIGILDESFGKGGAEDGDYCLRAHLKDVPIRFVKDSYLIHFSGRSTWQVESQEDEEARRFAYEDVFTRKWGAKLSRLAVLYDWGFLKEHKEAQVAFDSGDMKKVVQLLFE